MVLQGGPEVLTWSPEMSKWKHQAYQMATPRSQKGPAAEGVAVKIMDEKNGFGYKDALDQFMGCTTTVRTND